LAYLLSRLDGRLSLPGLIVGSFFPDVEIPIVFLFFNNQFPLNRLVLHSLLGGATIGTLLAAASTALLYPRVMGWMETGLRSRAREKCIFSANLIVSCLLGVLSHVLLDVTDHPFNPIFWSFFGTLDTPSEIFFALERIGNASTIIHLSLGAIMLGLLVKNRGDDILLKLCVGASSSEALPRSPEPKTPD
jgi:hypothetical protein